MLKTYIYSIPEKIQSLSKKIDVKATLCGKAWEVFNDEGIKQLFIFKSDGSLLVTNNGVVMKVSWEYISANSSILITDQSETLMFTPAFLDSIVFALRQDGTDRYLFMVDQDKKDVFPNLTLKALADYVAERIKFLALSPEEKRSLLEEERKQKEAQLAAEAEIKRLKEIEEQERREKKINEIRERYKDEIEDFHRRGILERKKRLYSLIPLGICIIAFGELFSLTAKQDPLYLTLTYILTGVLLISFLAFIMIMLTHSYDEEYQTNSFIEKKLEETEDNSITH